MQLATSNDQGTTCTATHTAHFVVTEKSAMNVSVVVTQMSLQGVSISMFGQDSLVRLAFRQTVSSTCGVDLAAVYVVGVTTSSTRRLLSSALNVDVAVDATGGSAVDMASSLTSSVSSGSFSSTLEQAAASNGVDITVTSGFTVQPVVSVLPSTSLTQPCSNDCTNGNGICTDGICTCYPGFASNDCSVMNCTGNCSSQGTCHHHDMPRSARCVCEPFWMGDDCATQKPGMRMVFVAANATGGGSSQSNTTTLERAMDLVVEQGTIFLQPGIYFWSSGLNITDRQFRLVSLGSVTFDGRGSSTILRIARNSIVQLEGLILRNGSSTAPGGAVQISGTSIVTFSRCLFDANKASLGGIGTAAQLSCDSDCVGLRRCY